MSYYRDTYLKSEDWKVLRAAKIALSHSKCCLCRNVFESIDVHHLKYKHLFDVLPSDLRCLCRSCHDLVHQVIDKYPKITTLPADVMWKLIRKHVEKKSEYIRGRRRQIAKRKRSKGEHFKKIEYFSRCRDVLVSIGWAVRHKLKWNDELFVLGAKLRRPLELLQAYIEITGIDPRTPIAKLGTQKLLAEHNER